MQILPTDNNPAARNDDVSRLLTDTSHQNVDIVKRSSPSVVEAVEAVEQPPARLRPRVFRKKLRPAKLTHVAQAVPSAGARQKNHRSPKRIQAILDDRLKRFRMLDPEEFQEMLKSMSQHHSSEQSTGPIHMDTIDGIQLASESNESSLPLINCSLCRLLVT